MKYQEALRASLTPLGRVFKIGGMFLYGFATNNARAESPKAPSPGQAKRHPGLRIVIALTPCKGKSVLWMKNKASALSGRH